MIKRIVFKMAQACTVATITMAVHKAFLFLETAYWWLDYGRRADGRYC